MKIKPELFACLFTFLTFSGVSDADPLTSFEKFFEASEKATEAPNPENESFFNSSRISPAKGQVSEGAAAIIGKIERSLVLPPSLLSSFVMVAEKRFEQLERPTVRTSDKLESDTFFQESVSSAFYGILHPNGQGYTMNRLISPPYFSRGAISLIEGMNANSKGTVQVLIGDHGASGVSSLVQAYAEASGRKLIVEVPSFAYGFDQMALARFIQFSVSGERAPILFFDELARNSQESLDAILTLVSNRSLIGNATVIVALGGSQMKWAFKTMPYPLSSIKSGFTPNEGVGRSAGIMRGIIEQADAIHFVRNPQAWQDYARIIPMMYQERFGAMPNTPEMDMALQELAKAALRLQVATGTSSIRDLMQALHGRLWYGYSRCDNLVFRVSTEEQRAKQFFKEALQKFWHAHPPKD